MLEKLFTDIAGIWNKYGMVYLDGIKNTVILATAATVIGCVIGLICGILNTIPVSSRDPLPKRIFLKIVRIILRVYVEVFRGTPMILQAVFIYYGIPYFFGVSFDSIWTVSIVVVSINTGAYMAESVRGGIMSIDIGQTEGAKAIGMNHWQTMTGVILPQAFRNILPQIGNNYIINIKDTSVMFIIGFSDFFAVHKMVSGAIFTYFPSAFMEMFGYLVLTLVASGLLRLLEKHMKGDKNYELASGDQLVMAAGTYKVPSSAEPFEERSREFGGKR